MHKMTKHLLSVFAAFTIVSAASAQTFTTLPFATMDSTHDCNEWVDDYVYLVNNTGAPLSLDFVRLTNTMDPNGWDVLLCTNVTCCPVVPPSGTLGTLADGDSAFLHLTCGFIGIQGNGTVRLRVYEVGNPTNDDTITFTYHAINAAGVTAAAGKSFHLGQNYPNPFSGSTTSTYELGNAEGKMVITDIQGRVVTAYTLAAGTTSITLSDPLAPGIYFYSLYRGDELLSKRKMIAE